MLRLEELKRWVLLTQPPKYLENGLYHAIKRIKVIVGNSHISSIRADFMHRFPRGWSTCFQSHHINRTQMYENLFHCTSSKLLIAIFSSLNLKKLFPKSSLPDNCNLWEMEIWASPVPGGMSTTSISSVPQWTPLVICSIAFMTWKITST